MSMFHSTVSRREFHESPRLQRCGNRGGFLASPVFHDMDELLSFSAAQGKRPWWVKEVDNPTIEIDYSMMERHDSTLQGQSAYMRAFYLGADRVLSGTATGNSYQAQRIAAGEPGWDVRFQALSGSYKRVSPSTAPTWSEVTVPGPVQTPEARGEPKWTGTPEEATMMLRAAMRIYGAELVLPVRDESERERPA